MEKNEINWDKYAESRLLARNRLLFEHHRLLTRYFLDFFKDIDPSVKVLDVGCGDGFFLELLRDLGFENLFGIDLSEPMLCRARKKNLRVGKENIYELDGKEEYNVILLMDVLEHLDRPKVGLKNLYNILKNGGILFLNIPGCDSLAKRCRRLVYLETRLEQMKNWDETHMGGYSKKEVINLLKGAGFKICKSRRISNHFPIIGRFSKIVSHFLQQFTILGLFGDLLVIIAKKERK